MSFDSTLCIKYFGIDIRENDKNGNDDSYV